MGNLPQDVVLTEAALCFIQARRNLIEGAAYLYQISTNSLWEGKFSSLGAYVEQECQLSQGYASKLIKAYEHYVVEGGLSQRKIEGTDPEKLYLAIALTGTPEEQAMKAETLTRSELKQERAMKDDVECEHLTTIHICASCHQRV